MMRSLFAAVSGLRNHQLSLSVIGNNISNINTIGFKNGRALFKEMLSETIQGASRPNAHSAGTNPKQIGLGMSVASIAPTFSQGQLQLTGNMLDLAIQGDGFFVMRNGEQQYFGRAGAFGFDGDGRLTAGQGLLVQGWAADSSGTITSGSPLTDIVLPFGQKAPAQATTSVALSSNLDSSAQALSTITRTNAMLARSQASDQLQTLFDSGGRSLGVQSGDSINVQYAGTGSTLVTNLSTAAGSPMDLVDGDTILVSDGTGSTNLVFSDAWTLSDLATEIQTALNVGIGTETDIQVTVNQDGSLLFTNPAGGNGIDVNVTVSAAGRDAFNSLIASVPVIEGTSTARSAETIVDRTLVNGQDFSNLSDLAAALDTVFQLGSVGSSVAFSNGQFLYDNTAGAADLRGVSITRSGATTAFAEAMGLTGTDLATGSTWQSDTLLDTASATDDLVNLFDRQGQSLGLTTGGVFTFDAMVGGAPISQATFTVVNTGDGSGSDRNAQTLGGLMGEMEDVLDLTTAGGVTLDDGALVVNGRSGLSNELTGLAFAQPLNPGLATALGFNQTQAATDVTHEASIRVFDSLGTSHLLSMVFTKDNDVDNRWTWEASIDDGQIMSGQTGSVTFNGDGSLGSFVTDDGSPLTVDPTTGADSPMVIEFDAGTVGGIDGITGFARESTTAIVDQDGFGMGTLESISIDQDGVITGVFTNGTFRPLAQIALASFNNTSGLQRDGGNGWMVTPNSGEPVIRRPGTDSEVGSISAGTLEMSNVDIAQEFTNMIVAQRGFQANARTVTTSDEMLLELVNLKR